MYVYLDGIVLKRSWAGEVRNVSLVVALLRFSLWKGRSPLRPGPGGSSEPSLARKLLIEAQASTSVPSTEKCSSDRKPLTWGWRSTAARNLPATSASSSRSRFFENVEWSQTASSTPSPT